MYKNQNGNQNCVRKSEVLPKVNNGMFNSSMARYPIWNPELDPYTLSNRNMQWNPRMLWPAVTHTCVSTQTMPARSNRSRSYLKTTHSASSPSQGQWSDDLPFKASHCCQLVFKASRKAFCESPHKVKENVARGFGGT